MSLIDGWDYDAVDIAALRRCVAMMRAESLSRRQQIEIMLTQEPWIDAARHAAYHCQMKNLNLPPWQQPPCTCTEDDAEANALLDRMLANDISQWEPDPLGALARVAEKV
jgi:hypothetical protein